MGAYRSAYIGYVVLIGLCGAVTLGMVLLVVVGPGGAEPLWLALLAGATVAGLVRLPFGATRWARAQVPRITRRDLLPGGHSYGDDTFALWAPRAPEVVRSGPVTRADVLAATLVSPDHFPEAATFHHYGGDLDPDEPKPSIRLTLRVYPEAGEPFETTDVFRVPGMCLAAVTEGRLVVGPDPGHPDDPARVGVDWPRSATLSGVRPYRVVRLDGRRVDLTGRIGPLLEMMRIARAAGGIPLDGDTIDLRTLDPGVAARAEEVLDRAGDAPGPWRSRTEPGPGPTWVVGDLPGDEGGFGGVTRAWARAGGRLADARFLEMRGTTTFQSHGPVLETVLRIHPGDGGAPFDVRRKLTVPLNYLALLHRTRDVVVRVSPDRQTYDVDWERSNLLAGATPATVIAPDGREFTLTGRAGPLRAVMDLLVAHGIGVRGATLDLRRPRYAAVVPAVTRAIDAHGTPHGG
ncbi:hypothetical protein [Streptomyces specialis]|uniref:hypothetical protein n=1 Tax=Streptomyces specialis TaxID=498367 RepID=UPI00073E66CC|nr:hypothetical protein [Streptomyces specialis]